MHITITVECSDGNQVYNWCQENCKGEWKFAGATTTYSSDSIGDTSTDLLYIFEDEDDLMLVRLVWGGTIRRIRKNKV